MRNLLFRLVLVLLTLAPGLTRSQAHEATMGVIEFREMRAGTFIGKWTSEPNIGAAKVQLRMPQHCFLQMPELSCGSRGLVGPISVANMGDGLSALLVKVFSLDGAYHSYTLSSGNPTVTVLGAGAPTTETWIELARTYVNYGIDHILLGADHLLFVLGLIWIVQGGWKLVKTITAFTIGHSLSLAAAAFGLFGIPERPLNATIALSIVFVAVEIVRLQRGESTFTARRPWTVAFVFGLVHGIGFAGALAGLGIEVRLLPAALLFFNVGVEIGQLAFVLLVLALIWAHRRLQAELPRWGDAIPAYAIGSVAMFWFIGRAARIFMTSTLS
ncbi:HupE/UreJ family protein [Bradyrhizobium sp. INPA01-394B]|uniref:HupE/UreJ family protein n=1 Tax=Bradyrhizobium campsiandrae TaxID=1729892 RepID=A0ABR7U9W5_9BRAD|nr:HupE/UreJ family protein [Bradyrhizobium campsiandrae]MBC9879610.1 HupE/UreJ family protein [Bradyrhizobium campsiandrae]MBC9980785.1 HupE/UreJ family protein [Bradyrhizobium campsiandrae]